MASYASSSFSSSSSSKTFGCVHGLDVADYDTNNRFNKTISNNQLFTLFTNLSNAAFPILDSVSGGVFFKHFDVDTTDWTPSGGQYYQIITHYLDNRYNQVTGYYKPNHKQFKFSRIYYFNTKQLAVFVNQPVNCKIVVQTDPGPLARGKRKFTDDCVIELRDLLEDRFIVSSSSSSSSSSLSIVSSSSESSSSSSVSSSSSESSSSSTSSSSSVSSSSSTSSSSSSFSFSLSISSSSSSSSSSDSFSSSSQSSSSSSVSSSSSSLSSSSSSLSSSSSSSSLSSSSSSLSSSSSSSSLSSSESSSSSSLSSSSSSSVSSSSSSESSSSSSESSSSVSSSCFMSPNDSFDGDGIFPSVHKWYYDMSATNTPKISGGRLHASVSASANSSLVNSRWYVNAGSDFDVNVDWFLPSAGNPNLNNPATSANGWFVGIEAREIDNDDNMLRMQIQGNTTTYREQVWKNGVSTSIHGVATEQTSGSFRITRIGNQWQGYYRNTGGTWSQMLSGTNIGSNIDTEFRLFVLNGTSNPEAYGEFDNFALTSGDWECVGSSSSVSSSSVSSSSSSLSSSSSSSSSSLSSSESSSSSSLSESSSSVSSSSVSNSSSSQSSSSSSVSNSESSSSSSLSSSSSSSTSESCFVEINDDFNYEDGVPNVHRWDVLMGAANTPVVSGARLTFRVDENNISSLVQHRMTIPSGDDFDTQIDWDISPSANNGISGWNLFFEVREVGNDDNKIKVYQKGHDTTYIEEVWINGVLEGGVPTGVTNNASTGKFRITRISDQWQSYYWNGSSWSQIGATSVIPTSAAEVRIGMQTYTNKPDVEGYVDNFTFSGAYDCPESSVSSSSSSSSSESSSSESSSSSSESSSSSSESFSLSISSSSSSSSSSVSSSSSSTSSSSTSFSSSSESSSSTSSSSSSISGTIRYTANPHRRLTIGGDTRITALGSSSSSSYSSSSSSSVSSSSRSSSSVAGVAITELRGWKTEPDSIPSAGAMDTEEPLLVDSIRYTDVGTYWASGYSYGIELGSAQELTKMKIYGNTSAAFVTPTEWVDDSDTFVTWTSLDGVNWTQYQTYIAPTIFQATSNVYGGQWGYHLTLTNTSGSPVTASWIKVRYTDVSAAALLLPNGEALRIGEIELFGVNSSSSSSTSSSSSSSSSSVSSSSKSSSSKSSSSFSTTPVTYTVPRFNTDDQATPYHYETEVYPSGGEVVTIVNYTELGSGWEAMRTNTPLVSGLGGKFYWEVKPQIDNTYNGAGIVTADFPMADGIPAYTTIYGITWLQQIDATRNNNTSQTAVGLGGASIGDIVMLALEVDTGKFYVGLNGVWGNSAIPSAGTGWFSVKLSGAGYPLYADCATATSDPNPQTVFYFAEEDWTYTAPPGFVAMSRSSSSTSSSSYASGGFHWSPTDKSINMELLTSVPGNQQRIVKKSSTATSHSGIRTYSPLPSTGKFYIEWWQISNSSSQASFGVADSNHSFGATFVGGDGSAVGVGWLDNYGRIYHRGSYADDGNYNTHPYTTYNWVSGDVIMLAVDMDTGGVWFGVNGTWNISTPSAGGTADYTETELIGNSDIYVMATIYSLNNIMELRTNQGMSFYAPPSGFVMPDDTFPISRYAWNEKKKDPDIILTNADETASPSAGGTHVMVLNKKGITTGKYYWEVDVTASLSSLNSTGIHNGSDPLNAGVGNTDNSWGLHSNGTFYAQDANDGVNFGLGFGGAHINMVALDMTAGKVWIGTAGTWAYRSGDVPDPANGVDPAFESAAISGTMYPAEGITGADHEHTIVYRQSEFTYSIPTGFVPLNGSYSSSSSSESSSSSSSSSISSSESAFAAELFVWGDNTYGQLGDGTIIRKSSPVQIGAGDSWLRGDVSFQEISGPELHFAAVKTSGSLWTWGQDGWGSLGQGDLGVDRSSPTQVGALTDWDQVACAYYCTGAIKKDGTLWTWGQNNYGQQATGVQGAATYRSSPAQVGADTHWRKITAGRYHYLALRKDGTLWTWGANINGVLAQGDQGVGTYRSSPVQVGSASNWVKMVAGDVTSHALNSDGEIWGWGSGSAGQIGDEAAIERSSPVQVSSGNKVWSDISSNGTSCLALTTSGSLWVWGANSLGQLGLGDNTNRSSPTQIGALTDWAEVFTHRGGGFAINTSGELYSWGNNNLGELGDGTTIRKSSPVQVGASTRWIDMVITNDQTVYAFRKASSSSSSTSSSSTSFAAQLFAMGINNYGQLGDGTIVRKSSPVQIGSLNDWRMISAGGNDEINYYDLHSVAIKKDGTLWTWGGNARGELGDETIIDKSSPLQVGSETYWWKADAGGQHTLAIDVSGGLWTWGGDGNGCLGSGTLGVNRSSPVQIGSDAWKNVAGGGAFSLAVKQDGTLWSWGDNQYGQLGDGTNGLSSYRSSPVQVGAANDWDNVFAIRWGAVAFKSDGTLFVWGRNNTGIVGDGTIIDKSSPVQVSGNKRWSKVSINGEVAIGSITTSGSLWMWGANYVGQLGQGDTVYRSSPTQVGSDSDWAEIACSDHVNAIKTDGTLYAWGNDSGYANNEAVDYSSPVQIGSDTDWLRVDAGATHTLALRSSSSSSTSSA